MIGIKNLLLVVKAAIIMLAAICSPAYADQSEVVLTVEGIGATQEYSIADLREIDEVEFTTTTNWTEGDILFTGVPLASFVKSLGLTSGTLFATAVNDYSIDFPIEDALNDGPIIAYLMNGEEMSIRDKGPLWIVYPYDSDPSFQSEVAFSRSIWQLVNIRFDG